MIPWTAMERRWCAALMEAMLPGYDPWAHVPSAVGARPRAAGVAHPGLAAVDREPFWVLYEDTAPPLLRFGLRAAVWLLTLMPLLLIGRPRLFHRLEAADRDRFLVAAAGHRLFLVRQLAMTIKLLACFAYFRDSEVRERFGAAA